MYDEEKSKTPAAPTKEQSKPSVSPGPAVAPDNPEDSQVRPNVDDDWLPSSTQTKTHVPNVGTGNQMFRHLVPVNAVNAIRKGELGDPDRLGSQSAKQSTSAPSAPPAMSPFDQEVFRL